MDAVVNSPFILIYLSTDTVEENVYESEFYKQLYLSVDDRYIDHLRGLYLVHPNFWMKVSTRQIHGIRVLVRNVRMYAGESHGSGH